MIDGLASDTINALALDNTHGKLYIGTHAGLSIYTIDYDRDDLANVEELEIYGTNPMVTDTDGDGFTDGDEVRNGTDPLVPDIASAEIAISSTIFQVLGTTILLGALIAMIFRRKRQHITFE